MKRSRIAFIGVFPFALLARVLYLSGFRHNPFFGFNAPYLDPDTFQRCAEAFLDYQCVVGNGKFVFYLLERGR